MIISPRSTQNARGPNYYQNSGRSECYNSPVKPTNYLNKSIISKNNEKNDDNPQQYKTSYLQNQYDSQVPRKFPPPDQPPYYYLIGRSNNPLLVKRIFKHRSWWKPALSTQEHNMYWVPFPQKEYFDRMDNLGTDRTAINHFPQGTRVLTSKIGLFQSVKKYMSSIGQDPFSILPWTTILYNGNIDTKIFQFVIDTYENNKRECKLCHKKLSDLEIESLKSKETYDRHNNGNQDNRKNQILPSNSDVYNNEINNDFSLNGSSYYNDDNNDGNNAYDNNNNHNSNDGYDNNNIYCNTYSSINNNAAYDSSAQIQNSSRISTGKINDNPQSSDEVMTATPQQPKKKSFFQPFINFFTGKNSPPDRITEENKIQNPNRPLAGSVRLISNQKAEQSYVTQTRGQLSSSVRLPSSHPESSSINVLSGARDKNQTVSAKMIISKSQFNTNNSHIQDQKGLCTRTNPSFLPKIIKPHKHQLPKNVYILKPNGGRQGKDIVVVDTIEEIYRLIKNNKSIYVLQKYIENPHLYYGRKYDIRAFGLLHTNKGGYGLVGYSYKHCYLRTSSSLYKLEDFSNPFIHLTNDAVQRNSHDFGRYENNNKVTMVDYRQYFINQYGIYQGEQTYISIRNQMDNIMKIVYSSVENSVNVDHFPFCFQLIGFDFLITDDFKVKLLETNTSPSIQYDPILVPFKEKLFPRMLEEVFELTIDKFFPPPEGMVPDNAEVKWTFASELQEEKDNGANGFRLIFPWQSSIDFSPLH